MPTTTTSARRILATLLAIVALLAAAPSAGEKHISVYSPVAIYTLPVLDRAGREYAGLLELLEPLGRVSSQTDGRRWRLRYNSIDAEFTAGKTRAKIRGHNLDLSAPFLMENSRGLVPLSSVSALLLRFLETPVNFHESARRLFVGEVGIQTSFRLEASDPPRLLVNFSAPVNPAISTEPGKLRIVFTRDPVVPPGSQPVSFASKAITEASYSESNGDAEFDITASEPLRASLSNDRKTIVVSFVPPATAPGIAGPQNPAQAPSAATISSIAHRVLAVVDPAHGGDERGAALTDTLAEKMLRSALRGCCGMNWRFAGSRSCCCATAIPVPRWTSAPRRPMLRAPESTSACTPSPRAAARMFTRLCFPWKEPAKEFFMRGMWRRRRLCPSAGWRRRRSWPKCRRESFRSERLRRRCGR